MKRSPFLSRNAYDFAVSAGGLTVNTWLDRLLEGSTRPLRKGSHLESFHRRRKRVDKLVVYARVHVDPLHRTAALPVVVERAVRDGLRSLSDVRVGPDVHGVLSP